MKSQPYQSVLKLFPYQSVCIKNNRSANICISQSCQASIYKCSSANCQCLFAHKQCQSISLQYFCNLLKDYKTRLNEPLAKYLHKFHAIYQGLQRQINQEINIFNKYFQHLLFGSNLNSILRKIEQRKTHTITSKQVNNILKSVQQQNISIFNYGKFTTKQAQKLKQSTKQLLNSIQDLYKTKLQISWDNKRSNSQCSIKFKPYQSSCLQRKNSSKIIKSQMQNSSNLIKTNLQNKLCKKEDIMWSSSVFSSKISRFQSQFSCKPPKINLEYPKFIDSKIINNASSINQLIGKKIKMYQLLFRATDNKFQMKKFYQLMQQQQKSIKTKKHKNGYLIMLKTQFNNVIGAFTQKIISRNNVQKNQIKELSSLNPEQSSNASTYIEDIHGSTFLCSISHNKKYYLSNPYQAIYIGKNSIGFGQSDLRIKNHANTHTNIFSIGNTFKTQQKGFQDYKQLSKDVVGSLYTNKFAIKEWEMFRVNFHHS